ncbi:MAG TPA: glycosyltransferase, partial [Microbacteriaceae bacterium]|nr:glycosyltransferase [Microbacteriaceae bacterium]
MTAAATTLVLIAKECVPGRVKTRLHPPFTLEEAATIASACLLDTLAAVAQLPAGRRILYFDG